MSSFISSGNKLKLKLLEAVAPRFTQQLPYNAALLTQDQQEQEKGLNDPLNHRYKSASIVQWIVRTGQNAIDSAHLVTVPTLLLIPGSDAVIDATQTEIFAQRIPSEHLTVHYYDNYLHEILNETPERRERVMDDIRQWISKLA